MSAAALPTPLQSSNNLIRFLNDKVQLIQPSNSLTKAQIKETIDKSENKINQRLTAVYKNHREQLGRIVNDFFGLKAVVTFKDFESAYEADWTKLAKSIDAMAQIIKKTTGRSPDNSPPIASYIPPSKFSPPYIKSIRTSRSDPSKPYLLSKKNSPQDEVELPAAPAATAATAVATTVPNHGLSASAAPAAIMPTPIVALTSETDQKSSHEPFMNLRFSAAGLVSSSGAVPLRTQSEVVTISAQEVIENCNKQFDLLSEQFDVFIKLAAKVSSKDERHALYNKVVDLCVDHITKIENDVSLENTDHQQVSLS